MCEGLAKAEKDTWSDLDQGVLAGDSREAKLEAEERAGIVTGGPYWFLSIEEIGEQDRWKDFMGSTWRLRQLGEVEIGL